MRIVTTLLLANALVFGAGAMPVSAQVNEEECTTIKATLSEYKIKLNKKSATAGCVEFKVINRGVEDHELIIVKGRKARSVPQHEGVVEEDDLAAVGETGDLETLERAKLPVELSAGKYVVFCNVLHDESGEGDDMSDEHGGHADTKSESHFGEGMHVIFTVKRA